MRLIFSLILISTLTLLSCSHSHSDVKSITITVDPNNKENKYQVINLFDKDSIQVFMEQLNNRESELVKFYPKFTIEINYSDKSEKYLGNANHVKDEDGLTYKLLSKDWEIFTTNKSSERNGYVPDAETAIKIAEAAWFPIYGKEVLDEKPFQAILQNDSIWIVEGTLHDELGGVAHAEIQRKDGKILKVIHGK